jgi:hypothetical protein
MMNNHFSRGMQGWMNKLNKQEILTRYGTSPHWVPADFVAVDLSHAAQYK